MGFSGFMAVPHYLFFSSDKIFFFQTRQTPRPKRPLSPKADRVLAKPVFRYLSPVSVLSFSQAAFPVLPLLMRLFPKARSFCRSRWSFPEHPPVILRFHPPISLMRIGIGPALPSFFLFFLKMLLGFPDGLVASFFWLFRCM